LRRLKLPWLLDVTVVAAGVLTIALLVFSTSITSSTIDHNSALKDELSTVKVQVALSHVWLEEALAGDRGIDVERQVFANLSAARRRCLALRNSETDRALTRLCARVGVLRVLAARRWKKRRLARAGGEQDQRYDEDFRAALALAVEAGYPIDEAITRARTTLDRINAGIVAGVVLIFVGMALAVRRRVRQLAVYNEQLRRLDGIKDDLIASVSHELRTPLTATIGFLKTLERADVDLDGDAQRELIEIARVQAERLARLVDDLLFFAQLENGGIRLMRGNVDIAELADECVRATRPLACEKGVVLRFACKRMPRLRGDRARLAQLLDNLVSNAIKFTPPGGRVDVLAHANESEVRLEVADTGFGVPAAEQPHLFERFFRASPAMDNAVAGTGLGLTIAKAIVDAHEGEITIQSELGRGTSVRVRLPIGRDAGSGDS
jgi:signal transduction histidine kinase